MSSASARARIAAEPGVELRLEVEPRWCFRLPALSTMDGLVRVRGGVLHRLLHINGSPVRVRVAQLASGRVLFGAEAEYGEQARVAIELMRRALGVDQDLGPFHAGSATIH